ncbi:hypothetical protein DOFOFD_05735 [Acetobacteraceae bacterium EV16P]|uniref:Uncharacterized protein n=1 Tax=Sorlinia euscelidii TaxID=3081148 RepID=A0ABU7U106_9PROT
MLMENFTNRIRLKPADNAQERRFDKAKCQDGCPIPNRGSTDLRGSISHDRLSSRSGKRVR